MDVYFAGLRYTRQRAIETYITEFIVDPTKIDELVPLRRFPLTILREQTISEPPTCDNTMPINYDEERVSFIELRRRSNIEQSQTKNNPMTSE